MGFIYGKPLSMEQIFSQFIKKGTAADVENGVSKRINTIFESFNFQAGMTLQEFENANIDAYQQYEELATEFYSRQQMKNAISESDYEVAAKAYKEVKQKQDDRLEKLIEESINNVTPKFGLDGEPEEYVKPDPTMCRDPKTHDW